MVMVEGRRKTGRGASRPAKRVGSGLVVALALLAVMGAVGVVWDRRKRQLSLEDDLNKNDRRLSSADECPNNFEDWEENGGKRFLPPTCVCPFFLFVIAKGNSLFF